MNFKKAYLTNCVEMLHIQLNILSISSLSMINDMSVIRDGKGVVMSF